MQAELGDQLRIKHFIQDTVRTFFIVALVCMVMPFVTVTVAGVTETYSVYNLIATFYKSEIGLEFSLTSRGVILSIKIIGLLLIGLGFFGLAMLFNKNKATKTADNSRWTFGAALLEIPFIILYFYYFYRVILVEVGRDATVVWGIGGITMLICFALGALILLMRMVKKRTTLAGIIILLVIPLTILLGLLFLNDRKYYVVSLMIIFEAMLPFFMIFESRKPEARELILIAVIAAIAVAGRAAFFMLPQFKPVVAIVMIAGICLGAEAGFFTGALTGFVSNFFFGQGPWTPWQMFAFGIIGFLAGVLFKKGLLAKRKIPLCIFGFFATLIIYGFLLDTATILTTSVKAKETFWFAYITGFPFNVIHGTATAFFLFVLAKPMMEKIERIKKKYGMMEP